MQIRLINGYSSIEKREEKETDRRHHKKSVRCVTNSCTTEQLQYSRIQTCEQCFHSSWAEEGTLNRLKKFAGLSGRPVKKIIQQTLSANFFLPIVRSFRIPHKFRVKYHYSSYLESGPKDLFNLKKEKEHQIDWFVSFLLLVSCCPCGTWILSSSYSHLSSRLSHLEHLYLEKSQSVCCILLLLSVYSQL